MPDIRTTPQLDNFIRADEDPLSGGGKWGQFDSVVTTDNLQNLTNAATGHLSLADRFWNRYWTASSFDGDQEIWAMYNGNLGAHDWGGLGLLTNAGGAGVNHQGYIAYDRAFGGAIKAEVYRYDTWDSGILLDSVLTSYYVTNRTLKLFRLNGTQLQTFYSVDEGANWTALNDVVDNTYRTGLWMLPNFVGLFSGLTAYIGFGGGNPREPLVQVMRYR